ncbi:Putative DNA-binding protein YwzG [Clostridium chauvoei JF4335]|nr:Putative DNA-binding protein YwzG [Clostridium chauvoei JF4335]
MLMSKELLKGIINILILSTLPIKDSYGYEIAKTIKEKSNNVNHASDSIKKNY